ncbi:MAG TPA: cytochrome P450 [Acidimicrobiales bacterium]|nr:cytochrome P450 [Acidimicrobiales bacterium]
MHLELADAAFNRDPYPALEEVRRAGRAVRDDVSGAWLVTGYEDCAAVLGNVRAFTSEMPEGSGPGVFGGRVFEVMDGPRHDEIRGVWAAEFQRRRLERHRPEITRIVDEGLDGFVPRVLDGEDVDAVEHLTRSIPTRVIAVLLGIDEGDQRQFSDWSDAMGAVAGALFDPSERGREILRTGLDATRQLNAYIAAEVAKRRAHPGDDLISIMVNSPVAGTMTEAEIVANNTQLVFAGNETTAKWMAHTLVTLAHHPGQRRALVADPARVPAALEEVLRFETVAQVGKRTVREAGAEIGGAPVEVGDVVTCLLGAADRDPDRWERPAAFDVHRPAKNHFGFGFGLHYCLGINLARLETAIWLDRLLDRLPEWGLAEGIDYGINFVLRGPMAVPVTRAA